MAHRRKNRKPSYDAVKASRSSVEDPAESDSQESTRPKPTAFDAVRDNAEAIILAVILAVIIRHFSVEAFEIPTGSMAPTLFGIHAWTDCPNCDTQYNVALQSDSTTGKLSVDYAPVTFYEGSCKNSACGMTKHFRGVGGVPLRSGANIVCTACTTEFAPDPSTSLRRVAAREYESQCPSCWFRFRDVLLQDNRTGGHKILVSKFPYTLGNPERWDVIVFTFDRWKNYIKRLVGKPGERVDLWNGDVYIDGKIEKKYLHPYVQDVLWTRIADSSIPERRLRDHPLAWQEIRVGQEPGAPPAGKLTQWNQDSLTWNVNAADEVAVLRYGRRFDNYYNYNLLRDTPSNSERYQVGDKRVEFAVRPLEVPSSITRSKEMDVSWVGAEIREGEFTFQLRLPVGKQGGKDGDVAVLERLPTIVSGSPAPLRRAAADETLRQTKPISLPVNRKSEVALEILDDRVAAYVGGELILSIEYDSLSGMKPSERPPSPTRDVSAHSLDLIVADNQVEFSDVRVYRDMYYIGRGENPSLISSVQLGEDQYFALGDNGPSSSDGRMWRHVPADNMMGKAFAVFWPAWPTNFQCKFIR